jgi:nitrogen fixation/metabolism regulation signal transduction histidine kinase
MTERDGVNVSTLVALANRILNVGKVTPKKRKRKNVSHAHSENFLKQVCGNSHNGKRNSTSRTVTDVTSLVAAWQFVAWIIPRRLWN